MTLGLIWAQAANGVIGRDNTVPWHLPEDLAHFRAVTAGATVVMGRRTWQSLPARFRPLPGRRNVVLTRDRSFADDGAVIVHDLTDALRDPDVWVIGGAAVYAEALPVADRAEITELRESFDGDVYAPDLGTGWRLASAGKWQLSSSGLHYRFLQWQRALSLDVRSGQTHTRFT
ncbi:MAG: dihydrofolate reductase [Actinomycetota bacterium]|nr:dihydrofolate reductase [Actinomycetota bacterium]